MAPRSEGHIICFNPQTESPSLSLSHHGAHIRTHLQRRLSSHTALARQCRAHQVSRRSITIARGQQVLPLLALAHLLLHGNHLLLLSKTQRKRHAQQQCRNRDGPQRASGEEENPLHYALGGHVFAPDPGARCGWHDVAKSPDALGEALACGIEVGVVGNFGVCWRYRESVKKLRKDNFKPFPLREAKCVLSNRKRKAHRENFRRLRHWSRAMRTQRGKSKHTGVSEVAIILLGTRLTLLEELVLDLDKLDHFGWRLVVLGRYNCDGRSRRSTSGILDAYGLF